MSIKSITGKLISKGIKDTIQLERKFNSEYNEASNRINEARKKMENKSKEGFANRNK